MAYALISIDGVWELQFHVLDGGPLAPVSLSRWWSSWDLVNFSGQLEVKRIVVPSRKQLWYCFTVSRQHTTQLISQIFDLSFKELEGREQLKEYDQLSQPSSRIWYMIDRNTNISDQQRSLYEYTKVLKERDESEKQILTKFGETVSRHQPISMNFFQKLSEEFDLRSSHWTIYFSNEEIAQYLNDVWWRISKSFWLGPLKDPDCTGFLTKFVPRGFVIEVRNHNCEVFLDVAKVEKLIRKTEIFMTLKYKWDIYSLCRIYQGNEAKLRPTVYKSVWDPVNEKSLIDNDYTEGYQPEVNFAGQVYAQYPFKNH